ELEKRVTFCEFEPIHLEYSFKFSKGDINKLAENTGFEVTEHFSDKKGYFVDSLWKVNKE
ncbi:MAG: L-histidine N(alpha)-methyltransferase, partial [Bdellovibrionales bacterium]|nr:L-histidine N(alpha)-methyltransferase [Bdellovibrionales bacterium]